MKFWKIINQQVQKSDGHCYLVSRGRVLGRELITNGDNELFGVNEQFYNFSGVA